MTTVMTSADIERSLRRLAHEILEATVGADLALVGIQTRGVPLAERLARNLNDIGGMPVPVGGLDISRHRDDRPAPMEAVQSDLPFGITEKTVILVDDVLYTGRTARAALDALIERGRPAAVRLVVLVDRGHRQLPVRADHVGKNLPTSRDQRVSVQVCEVDGVDQVLLEEVET
ncbi:MAG: bifunctional pyr operon transcriptional regulator/uracil phosphoribosyltransferase PyrR [Acidimicrobiia bacterium]|nr:bifunctional pyr operon transcriptional regulator/uracil phosphoribosyltransferase PyrR [Acidimicrobiia bacterium]